MSFPTSIQLRKDQPKPYASDYADTHQDGVNDQNGQEQGRKCLDHARHSTHSGRLGSDRLARFIPHQQTDDPHGTESHERNRLAHLRFFPSREWVTLAAITWSLLAAITWVTLAAI